MYIFSILQIKKILLALSQTETFENLWVCLEMFKEYNDKVCLTDIYVKSYFVLLKLELTDSKPIKQQMPHNTVVAKYLNISLSYSN